ncbi:WD40 repeat-like protein [Armillaria gallica]|uniref:WD40 repeat-like protein n=1 Tax=Armillaria gallica TaxID=47427 RepID=A0A2H3D8K6_ARMGA|nr:WD40 repeat-like protein [Armillaria gallica]
MASLLHHVHEFLESCLASPEECYHMITELTGSSASVNCLSFSSDGELLASGDDAESIHIYDTHTAKRVQLIQNPGESWGQISSITWLPSLNRSSGSLALSFGTGRGIVAAYKRAKNSEALRLSPFPSSDSVEALSYDPHNMQLVVSSQHGEIKLYELDRTSWTLNIIWATKLKNTIPRLLCFIDEGRQLVVFCLESKEMLCIVTEDGKPTTKWSRILRSPIGSAALYKCRHLLVDNLKSGLDLYAFPHSSTRQSFHVLMRLECSIIKDAVFAEDSQVVVCGSGHGVAYVVSCSDGGKKPLQTLCHGKDRDYLQALDATTVSARHIVATGSSGKNGSVLLWEKPVKQLSKTECDLANAKDKIQLLMFAFVVWVSWPYLLALSDVLDQLLSFVKGILEVDDIDDDIKIISKPPSHGESGCSKSGSYNFK